ncbi:PLP-dependent transferase [Mucilaginibacter sp.]|nr:PLP-dependent transferase [Mucilaginibacter sp.]
MYSRAANPNRTSLENVLAKLEGGVDAAAFSSGNAAGNGCFFNR